MKKKRISKNFAWWLILIVFFVATILNVITESYLVASIMSIGFVFNGYKYLKYRKNKE